MLLGPTLPTCVERNYNKAIIKIIEFNVLVPLGFIEVDGRSVTKSRNRGVDNVVCTQRLLLLIHDNNRKKKQSPNKPWVTTEKNFLPHQSAQFYTILLLHTVIGAGFRCQPTKKQSKTITWSLGNGVDHPLHEMALRQTSRRPRCLLDNRQRAGYRFARRK